MPGSDIRPMSTHSIRSPSEATSPKQEETGGEKILGSKKLRTLSLSVEHKVAKTFSKEARATARNSLVRILPKGVVINIRDGDQKLANLNTPNTRSEAKLSGNFKENSNLIPKDLKNTEQTLGFRMPLDSPPAPPTTATALKYISSPPPARKPPEVPLSKEQNTLPASLSRPPRMGGIPDGHAPKAQKPAGNSASDLDQILNEIEKPQSGHNTSQINDDLDALLNKLGILDNPPEKLGASPKNNEGVDSLRQKPETTKDHGVPALSNKKIATQTSTPALQFPIFTPAPEPSFYSVIDMPMPQKGVFTNDMQTKNGQQIAGSVLRSNPEAEFLEIDDAMNKLNETIKVLEAKNISDGDLEAALNGLVDILKFTDNPIPTEPSTQNKPSPDIDT